MSGRIWSLSEQIKNVFNLSEFLLGTKSRVETFRLRFPEVRMPGLFFSVCLSEVYLSADFLFFTLVHKYFHAFWRFGILTQRM